MSPPQNRLEIIAALAAARARGFQAWREAGRPKRTLKAGPRRKPGPPAMAPKECINCRRLCTSKERVRGRCGACREYFKRTGRERPWGKRDGRIVKERPRALTGAERSRRRRDRLIRQGLCVYCGKQPPREGCGGCQSCLDAQLARYYERKGNT